MLTIEHPTDLDTSMISPDLQRQLTEISGMINRKAYHHLCIATFKQTIVGIGLSWGNGFHPHGERVSILTDRHIPEQETLVEAILSDLMEHLNTERYDHAMWSFDEDIHPLSAIASNNGFELVRKTWMPTLGIEAVLKDMKNIQPAEDLMTLKEVTQDPVLKNSFLQLLKDNYTSTHLISPVAEKPLDYWGKSLLDDQPDLKHSYIQFTAQITGYIMLHPVNEEEVEVGWTGTSEQQNLELLQPILKKQLTELKAQGFSKITPEVDTTDHFATGLFSFTDLEKDPAFLTYQLKLTQRGTST